MKPRLVVAEVLVLPVLKWDDGSGGLTPGPKTEPMPAPVSQLGQVGVDILAQVKEAEAQLLAAAEPDLPAPPNRAARRANGKTPARP